SWTMFPVSGAIRQPFMLSNRMRRTANSLVPARSESQPSNSGVGSSHPLITDAESVNRRAVSGTSSARSSLSRNGALIGSSTCLSTGQPFEHGDHVGRARPRPDLLGDGVGVLAVQRFGEHGRGRGE